MFFSFIFKKIYFGFYIINGMICVIHIADDTVAT